MRLGVKLIAPGAQLNNFKYVDQLSIQRGENPSLWFQLVDLDTGNRYIPVAGSTVNVSIPRFVELVPTLGGQADPTDYSVNQAAAQPFSQDASIWSTPLTSDQTAQMTSSNMKVTLQEPIAGTSPQAYNTSIAVVRMAIRVFGGCQ